MKARNGQKFDFFSNFWPILWNPLVGGLTRVGYYGQSGWLYDRMCAGLCPTYATALDAAEENRPEEKLQLRKTETVDGSVALGIIRKTGITSLNFWPTL